MRDQNFSMRCSEEFKAQVEDIRRAWPSLPSASEVLHQLVAREHERLSKAAG